METPQPQKRKQPTGSRKAARRAMCTKFGIANTGRQWRKLRKRLGMVTWRKLRRANAD